MFRLNVIDAMHVDAIRWILLNKRKRHFRQYVFLTVFSFAVDAISFISSLYVFLNFHLFFYNFFYICLSLPLRDS